MFPTDQGLPGIIQRITLQIISIHQKKKFVVHKPEVDHADILCTRHPPLE